MPCSAMLADLPQIIHRTYFPTQYIHSNVPPKTSRFPFLLALHVYHKKPDMPRSLRDSPTNNLLKTLLAPSSIL